VSHDTIILHGRPVIAGIAEGEALVSAETLSGWGGVDPRTGTIIETRHPLRGQSFRDKVLVFRGAKGSSGWSSMFHLCRLAGTAPRALVFNEMTTKIALGAVVMRIPAVTALERDPLDLAQTGDWVRVDGDRGVVEIRKRPPDWDSRAGAFAGQSAV
jgi:predicted aconitase with swiveling domain